MSAPRFTVVLPTWRRGERLRPTIESVLSQDETSWELLVVDDASPDDTARIAASVADDRITVLRRPEPSGAPSLPRNDGLAAARGTWIAYLDHDDLWEPGHLTALRDLLEAGAEVAATGCDWVDDDGTVLRRSGAADLAWSPELQLAGPLFEPSRVGHVAGLAQSAGGWRETDGLEDWDLWVRLSDRRWATSARRTVAITEAAGSRRHDLDANGWLSVAEVPDDVAAREVLRTLRRPAALARHRTVHVEVMVDWYRDELRSGRLVLPHDCGPDELLDALRGGAPADPWALLSARPAADGRWALGRALMTTGEDHLHRTSEVLRRRLEPKYRTVRRVAAAVERAPVPARSPS